MSLGMERLRSNSENSIDVPSHAVESPLLVGGKVGIVSLGCVMVGLVSRLA
jgi:hypothetical protein